MRIIAVLLLALLCRPLALWAQRCAGGRPTAREEWVEPHPVAAIARVAPRLLEELDWESLARTDSGAAVFLRARRWEWPLPYTFDPWRSLAYPGADVRVSLRPQGPWTRISVTAVLRCTPTYPAPAGTDLLGTVAEHLAQRTVEAVARPLASALYEARSEVPGDDCSALRDSRRKTRICMEYARRRMDDVQAQLAFALAATHAPVPVMSHDPVERLIELGANDSVRLLWSLQVQEHFGIALGRAERWEQAIAATEFAIGRGSIEPEVFYIAGLGYARTGDSTRMRERLTNALRLYRQAIPLRGANAQAWADMGLASSLMGQHAEAVALLERARLIDTTLLALRPMYQRALDESVQRAGPQPPAALRRP